MEPMNFGEGVHEAHPLRNQDGMDVSTAELIQLLGAVITEEHKQGVLPFVTVWTPMGTQHYRVQP